MQKSPWDDDYRTRLASQDDLRSERSTSAPPPETSFLFAQNDGLVAPRASYLGGGEDLNFPKWNRHSGTIHSPFTETKKPVSSLRAESSSFFSEYGEMQGRTSAPVSLDGPPPGFSRNSKTGLSSTFRGSDGMDRRAVGENIIRSQSAAPSFDGRLSMGTPLGLSMSDTPLVSNRTPGESYLESAMDTSRIVQMGQRRSSSTGVISGSINSSASVLNSLGLGGGSSLGGSSGGGGGAVRPAAKSLMDLIQEDFPPETEVELNGFRDEIFVERPRTTSPLSLQTRDYRYEETHDRRGAGTGLSDALDRIQVPHKGVYNNDGRESQQVQYVQAGSTVNPLGEDRRVQHQIYPTVPEAARPQPQRISQQMPYNHIQEHQGRQQVSPQGFALQQQPQVQYIQTHVLPTGQTVYLNAPSPQYGNATVQYQQILQQVPAGIGPNGEQYISVMPVQQSSHIQGMGPSGSFPYYSPDNQPNGMSSYVINAPQQQQQSMNVRHNGSPPTRTSGNINPKRQQNSGGRGKDRGGRGKRSTNNKRETRLPLNTTHSLLLENFKIKKGNREWTLLDIKGHVVEFCQDQNGSRFIQQRIESGSQQEKDVVMSEVLPAIRRLRNDVFANYVLQKLFDFGTVKMKDSLFQTLQGEMLQQSLQMYGCRVVQKALETLDESDVPKLLKEFHHNVLSCIHDQNGNHVIQKCIEVMCEKADHAKKRGDDAQAMFFIEQVDFIVDDVLINVPSLSCHPYGCRVLQRILEHLPGPKKIIALDEIKKCHQTLLDDQFGNYVIQHVLQYGRSSDRDSLLDIMIKNGILSLSKQKFASNVMEKLLKYGDTQQRSRLVKEMLKFVDEQPDSNKFAEEKDTRIVLLMVRDAYANYVVQTALDVVTDPIEKDMLMKELNTHSTELKNYTFAKHIVTKLETWSERSNTP